MYPSDDAAAVVDSPSVVRRETANRDTSSRMCRFEPDKLIEVVAIDHLLLPMIMEK